MARNGAFPGTQLAGGYGGDGALPRPRPGVPAARQPRGALMRHLEAVGVRGRRPGPAPPSDLVFCFSNALGIMWHGDHVARHMETVPWGLFQWAPWCHASKLGSPMALR